MKSPRKLTLSTVVLIVFSLVTGCVDAGEMKKNNRSEEKKDMESPVQPVRAHRSARPPVDLHLPDRLETATFALG
jgi:hypothetical protein